MLVLVAVALPELAALAGLEATEAAELTSDETEDAAEAEDPVREEVIEPLLLPVLLPPCGTGVALEVEEAVDAQVAAVGRLVTP